MSCQQHSQGRCASVEFFATKDAKKIRGTNESMENRAMLLPLTTSTTTQLDGRLLLASSSYQCSYLAT